MEDRGSKFEDGHGSRGCRRSSIVDLRVGPLLLVLALALLVDAGNARAQEAGPLDWPALTETQRPWTRWWWQGSAVDEQNLTAALEAYRAAGLGGVEVTPIYGVAGYEDQFIDYLSPTWMQRLTHTLDEAERLGLGVDMATGTGWPFGGPTVGAEDAAKYVAYETYELSGGGRLDEPVRMTQEPLLRVVGNRLQTPAGTDGHELQQIGRDEIVIDDLTEPIAGNEHLQALAIDQVRFAKPMPLQALVAYSADGAARVLTDRVGEDGRLDWTAPEGDWTLYAVFQGWHGKMVERAAPGGEGYALDHFSEAADDYFAHFSEALAGHDTDDLRAFFNDSYEVDDAAGEADWTPRFFAEFEARRGYDLREHLPALFGEADPVMNRLVLVDYRQTVSDLLLEHFTDQWDAWADEHGAMVRNQAHGSPANILDLYAASDIPETEGTEILRFKFASSAAHVTGKPLVAAEAATWLGEHFLSNLADVKQSVDRYFLGGVNHVVYHGTAYSPEDAPWPGWLFYAAVHFSPTSPLWTDFATLNEYVARAQSILQAGQPDNDVLLYLPIFDRYAERGNSLLVHFDGIEPFEGMALAGDAEWLQEHGYTFDFVSDRQLQATEAAGQRIEAGGTSYQTVVVPAAQSMPLETLEKLFALAEDGATVIFHGQMPLYEPGLADLVPRQNALRRMVQRQDFVKTDTPGIVAADHGEGQLLLGGGLDALLDAAGVRREPLVEDGLQFVRRTRDGGTDYFVANWTEEAVDGWVPLAVEAPAAALFDPMTGKTGVASTRAGDGATEVYLQLSPGESIVVRTFDETVQGPPFAYYEPVGEPVKLGETWQIAFGEGGPQRPGDVEAERLASWTELGGEAAEAFSGTATYTLEFDAPAGDAAHWRLALGEVRESARVRLNGHDLGTLIGPTYDVVFDADLLEERNVLEVDVSNLMANRIAAMERAGTPWKIFYNVNFPPRLRENMGERGVFDASGWEPMPSGLLGPVTLTPMAAR